MGLIDLDYMGIELNISIEDCVQAILRAYPRSIFHGNYALARTDNLDTTFENIMHKQLLVSQEIDCEDLVEGIRRHSIYRNCELPAENSVFVGLVEQLAGDPPTLVTLRENILEEIELSDTEQWLVDCFNVRGKKMLHRSELVQLALDSGRNSATIGIYTLFNPLLRNRGYSVYTVIGTEVSDQEVKVYSEVIRKSIPETEITYGFEGQEVILKVLPNMNALAGVIFPPKELSKIVKGEIFMPACLCRKLDSIQKIQFSVSNFWMGFTSIFKHANEVHNWYRKIPISVALNFEKNTATLLSDRL
jgi:hypothetical protein